MKGPLSDTVVLISIAATLLLIFGLIFSTRPPQRLIQSDIEWKDSNSLEWSNPGLESSQLLKM